MEFDPEIEQNKADRLLLNNECDQAMELYTKAAFSLIYQSDQNTCIKSAMEKAISCYQRINPEFSTDSTLDYIQRYFSVVRHWQDHRRLSPEQIQKEIHREIPLSTADDSREELPAGAVHSQELQSEYFDAALAYAQGIREEMEDAHAITHFQLEKEIAREIDLYCIFDGHGGKTCAQFSAMELPRALKTEMEKAASLDDEQIYRALVNACISVDESWKELPMQSEGFLDVSGSTAMIILYIDRKELWAANVGDSGAAIQLNGNTIQLTESAKPTVPFYYQEIYMRGGIVSYGRVDATLDMARSIGDLAHPSVSARPTIKKLSLSGEEHTLILACDGLWDVIDPQTAFDSIEGKEPLEAVELLRTLAYQRGSTDNVTIIVTKPKKAT